MRLGSLLVGLVLGVSLAGAAPALAEHFQRLVVLDAEFTGDELLRMAGEADELARRAQTNDAYGRAELKRRALDLSRRLQHLAARVADAPPASVRPDPRAQAESRRSMSDAAFLDLARVFESASFTSGRIAVLHQAALRNHFSVTQVSAVMDWFMLDREKVDVAALLWPRVVDPERAYMLYEKLDFDSSQRDLDRRLREATGPGSLGRPYMSMR